MPPDVLTSSAWLTAIHAKIVAPGEATFHSGDNASLLDYFVASDCMLYGFRGVEATMPDPVSVDIDKAAPTFEHSLVTYRFQTQVAALRVPTLKRFQRDELEPAPGPHRPIP